MIGYLLYFQIKCAINNLTTVEYHIEEIHYKNPFLKSSVIENMCDVLGDNYECWLCPTKPKFSKFRSDPTSYLAFDNLSNL